MNSLERQAADALYAADGRVGRAAAVMGISRHAMARLIKRYGIPRPGQSAADDAVSVRSFTERDTEPPTLRSAREPELPIVFSARAEPASSGVQWQLLPQPGYAHRLLVIPDTHAPYHDERAWQTMLAAARIFRPTDIIHLGDFADFYAVSFHSKDPKRSRALADELPIVRRLRGELDALGAQTKRLCKGNHENRLERFVRDRAPELDDLLDYDDLIGLTANGWQVCEYGEGFDVGHFYFTHDIGFCGKSAVQQSRAAAETNICVGHSHRAGVHYEGNARGVAKVGMSFGWLGDFASVDYRHSRRARREWTHGFGIGWMDPDGVGHMQCVPIIDGRCCINGVFVGVEV